MDLAKVSGPAGAAMNEKPGDNPAKLKNAVTQFEGLLLEQMLKSMRESGSGGWMGGGDDKSSESIIELAEQQFAKALAAGGGLGLAHSLTGSVVAHEALGETVQSTGPGTLSKAD